MRARMLASIVAMALVVASCGGEAAEHNLNVGTDPQSTFDLMKVGGGSYEDLTPEEVASRAEAMVEVRVIDVKPSHLNTQNGEFPSAADLKKYGGTSNLTALTDVEVEITRLIAGGSDGAIPDSGTMTITVGGGYFPTIVDREQAQLLGLTEVEVVGGSREHSEGDTGPPDVEAERPVESDDNEFAWGSSPDVGLSEGDDVIVLLTDLAIPTYEGGTMTILTIAHPAGVFRRADGDGPWRSDTRPEVDVDIEQLAATLG